jgi:hypothetical protein
MMLYPMMAQHLSDGEQLIEGFKANEAV